ncbi:hypothetical protein ACFV2H_32780 [Streptomyces sp. NPDC059629]|uniref:hypothetical protein n=1 Tax=Streptomyces sp. NPDC059629 TaxID=3346889 RepID=UPI00368C716E
MSKRVEGSTAVADTAAEGSSAEAKRRVRLTVEQFPTPLQAKGGGDCGCGSWDSCASEDCE